MATYRLDDPIIFDDLERIQVKVTLFQQKYVLVEASKDAEAKYQNRIQAGTQYAEGRAVISTGVSDAEALLLSMCLYREGTNGMLLIDQNTQLPCSSMLVPEPVLRSWPNRFTEPLLERLKEISAITVGSSPKAVKDQISKLQRRLALLEGQEESSKNSSSATVEVST